LGIKKLVHFFVAFFPSMILIVRSFDFISDWQDRVSDLEAQKTKLDIASGKIPPTETSKRGEGVTPSSKSISKRKKDHLERLHNPGGSRFIGRGLGIRKDEEYVSSPSTLREMVEKSKILETYAEGKNLNLSTDLTEGLESITDE
jgi:hypothetical protein